MADDRQRFEKHEHSKKADGPIALEMSLYEATELLRLLSGAAGAVPRELAVRLDGAIPKKEKPGEQQPDEAESAPKAKTTAKHRKADAKTEKPAEPFSF